MFNENLRDLVEEHPPLGPGLADEEGVDDFLDLFVEDGHFIHLNSLVDDVSSFTFEYPLNCRELCLRTLYEEVSSFAELSIEGLVLTTDEEKKVLPRVGTMNLGEVTTLYVSLKELEAP